MEASKAAAQVLRSRVSSLSVNPEIRERLNVLNRRGTSL